MGTTSPTRLGVNPQGYVFSPYQKEVAAAIGRTWEFLVIGEPVDGTYEVSVRGKPGDQHVFVNYLRTPDDRGP